MNICVIVFFFPLSSRMKRQSADVRTAEYLAWIALGGKVPSRGCEIVACGVVDVYSRSVDNFTSFTNIFTVTNNDQLFGCGNSFFSLFK